MPNKSEKITAYFLNHWTVRYFKSLVNIFIVKQIDEQQTKKSFGSFSSISGIWIRSYLYRYESCWSTQNSAEKS